MAKIILIALSTIICLILLYMADVFGRKKIVLVSSVVIAVSVTFTCFVPDLMTKLIFIGFASGAEGAFSALFTILINESTCK